MRFATPGEMRYRVRVRVPLTETDSLGGTPTVFTDGPLLWMSVEPTNQMERQQAQRAVGEMVYRLQTYYRTDIRKANRLLWEGRELIIYVITPFPRDNRLMIEAAEIER